ncbi:CHAT domain-containing protein [Gilvibacter sediminis]|uniref:CHAT domain-containing protein n=1 Tax=Gilvibacter sediminis TaxID=379071 RepID=UPI00234FDDD6|nr:CHAT domain-containing protein [Gilvibacter sediminis]MDC7996688.1 CHAT domain-containing protein [Gilvibacter sediminis]
MLLTLILGSCGLFLFWSSTSFEPNLATPVQVESSVNGLDSLAKKTMETYVSGAFATVIEATDSILPKQTALNEKDSLSLANIYLVRAMSFRHLYKSEKSLHAAQQGLLFCTKSLEGNKLKAKLYNSKAWAEIDLNYYNKSRKSILSSLELLNQEDDPNNLYLVGGYILASTLEAYYGDKDEAQRYLRLAERIYFEDQENIEKERRGIYRNYDRLEVMLPYRKAYNLWKLGTSTADSIQLEATIDRLQEIRQSAAFVKEYESQYYTTALNHAADWFISRVVDSLVTPAEIERARKLLNEAINLVEREGYNGPIMSFKYNKTKVLALAGEHQEADAQITALLESLSQTDPRRPFFYAQKGLIQALKKEKDSCIAYFYKAMSLAHSSDTILAKDYSNYSPSTVFGHTDMMVKIAAKLDEFYPKDTVVSQQVAKLYQGALKQFKASYADKAFNTKYNQTLRLILDGILELKNRGFGLEDIRLQEIINESETIRNQLAWKQFNQNRYTNYLPNLDSLTKRSVRLRTQLVKAKQSDATRSADSIEQLIRGHQRVIKEEFPNLDLLSNSKFSIAQQQSTMKADALILKYIFLKDKLALFSISKDDINVDIKPWRSEEKALLDRFVDNLKTQQYDKELAQDLSEMLLPEINAYSQLIINPDGELFQLPFEVLNSDDGYLFEEFAISYTSNLKFIDAQASQNTASEELAIYVPNYDDTSAMSLTRSQSSVLVGAQKEARTIGNLFSGKVYDESSLNKEAFITTSTNARMLHLAMHAEVNNDQPELSKFIFNSSENDDDHLYLEEIYGMSLGAELAVLSACNTGLGKENAGRSFESFQRAFTFAGVPATVASLWEVPDQATGQIMVEFYQNLKAGKTKSEALKLAKESFLAQHRGTKLAQPYYWAGFVIYGNDDAINTAANNTLWYTIAVLLFLGILVFWLLKRRTQAQL